jgi:hypothetical protein
LEQLVAEKLNASGYYVTGEFPYMRQNEEHIVQEFSVDLGASLLLTRKAKDDYWGNLNLLVECKYNYPGVRWVFTPHLSDIAIGCISRFDDLTNKEVAKDTAQYQLDHELRYCVRGIELHDRDVNLQSIPHGLNQLRYAVPHLVGQVCGGQMLTGHAEDLHIEFICPILVTTASLHILKAGLNLDTFQEAASLSALADQVDALVVYQPAGPELGIYANSLAQEFSTREGGRLDNRLKTRATILLSLGKKEWELPSRTWFDDQFRTAAERVLVVDYKAFKRMLRKLRRQLKKLTKSVSDIGSVSFNAQSGRGVITPFPAVGK